MTRTAVVDPEEPGCLAIEEIEIAEQLVSRSYQCKAVLTVE